MKFGMIIGMSAQTDILQKMQELKEIGMSTCQLSIWDTATYTDEIADKVLAASAETGIVVSTVWAGWTAPAEWNFIYGPQTLGLVPAAYRGVRLAQLEKAIPFAKRLGVKNIATHVGFMPENPSDPDYTGTIGALRHLCRLMKNHDINFLFETGQETPVTILRAIEDIGLDNVGINFDTANLMLYGKGNPVDALRVFGKYVKDLHIKDGFFPTDGRHLGKEVAPGEGLANFPVILKMLKELGYSGPYTIEREISGPQQKLDVCKTMEMLREIEKTL